MENKEIILNQTLHGYNHGHEFLAGSIILDSSSKRKMSYLSDLSGPEFSEEFDGYLEGYPLPNGQYVISRTWKATEMKRPGCVWTHSLIITKDNLIELDSILSINSLFKRPRSTDDFSDYQRPLKSQLSDVKANEIDGRSAVLAYSLLAENEKQIVVPVINKSESESSIDRLWNLIPSDSKYSLSFCCGYFSLTQPAKENFQIAFIPKTTRRFSYDKKTVVFFDNGNVPKNEVFKFFEDPDYSEILAFIFKSNGVSKESIQSSKMLYATIGESDAYSKLIGLDYKNLFGRDSVLTEKVFGVLENRFNILKIFRESVVLDAIIHRNYLFKNPALQLSDRIQALTDSDAVWLLRRIISTHEDDLKPFAFEIIDKLEHPSFNNLEALPAWLAIYIITSKGRVDSKVFNDFDQRELNSIVYQAFQKNNKITIDFLKQNFNHHKIRKASVSLLIHSNDSSIDSLFDNIRIDIDELSVPEAVELFKFAPDKFFSYFNLAYLTDSYVHNLLRNSPSDIHLDKLYEVIETHFMSKDVQSEMNLEILNFTFRRNSKASNRLFLATYPKLLRQLRGNSLLFERFLQIRSLLPFGKHSSIIDNLENLRHSLLVMAALERVSTRDFLNLIDTEDELRDIGFSTYSLSKRDRKSLTSQLERHDGNKSDKLKIHYLIDSLE